jgi:ankyrin repeat protein
MSPVQMPPTLSSGQQPDSIVVSRNNFRTSQDETVAHEMLARNKDVKIENRSRFSRAFTTKAKRTKYSDREIYRVLLSVVKAENASPGVVEVLTDLFIEQRGDVNFEPHKNGLFKKKQSERSRLLEMCAEAGNVEFVQILATHSDKLSLDASLEVALRDRNAGACRDVRRQNRMIQILVSRGASGSNTIDSAVRSGDIELLSLLLQGRPPQNKLSEGLPLAANFQISDTRRRLIRMLLQNGADPNYNGGEAISHVTRLFDLESLDMFLERLPHSKSLGGAFAMALNLPDSNNRFDACQKLIHAGASGTEVNKGLFIAITSEHQNISFLKLILLNASIDYENGRALCLAVEKEYMEHLQLMLEKRPNQTTFDGAFSAAIRLRNSRDGLKYCRILLGAGAPHESCSKALVYVAKAQRDELCRVFLEKGASPDFDQGAAVTAAVSSENIGILEMLVGGEYQKPHCNSLIAAFEVVRAMAPSRPKKSRMLRILLDAGLRGPSLDNALVEEVRKGQDGVSFCKLFLDYGASINGQGGEALDICARSGDLELLELLLQPAQQPRDEVLSRIFNSALKLDPRSRHLALKLILEANMPIHEQVAAAVDMLVQDRHPDMQTIKVLLSSGASVHYQNHRPLVKSALAFNKPLLNLLLEHAKVDSTASVVFETVMKVDSFWGKRDTFAILTILLEFGAEGASVNDALIKVVADTQSTARHFEVTLLQHRVDIDYKAGEALQIATERGEPGLVRRMLEMNPSIDSVSMAFPYAFHSKLGEASTLAVIDTFVELASDRLEPDFMHDKILEPPVFLCLNYYPASLKILESTLRGGYRADEPIITESGKRTALYFALSVQGKRVTDPVVELLIDQSGKSCDLPQLLTI